MSESHTPGPWQNGIDDLEGVVAPDQPGLGNVICLPPLKRMYSSLEAWPANARLISASPDLLKAAKFLLKELEWVNEQLDLMPDDYAEAQTELTAAIAKAEG